jgi:hypothetical protein
MFQHGLTMVPPDHELTCGLFRQATPKNDAAAGLNGLPPLYLRRRPGAGA